MDNYSPTYLTTHDNPLKRRTSVDSRRSGMNSGVAMNGSGLPMPTGAHNRAPSGPFPIVSRDYPAMGAFGAARSPPKAKSTSHVPCKFYPFGTCQAGAACQFSHDLDPTTQNAPCKYFAKGSCKFGHNCALAHILPDGRVINRPPRGGSQYGRRGQNAGAYQAGPPNSLISMQVNEPLSQQDTLYSLHANGAQQQYPPQHYQMSQLPRLDMTEAGSAYGSPPNGARLATSPGQRGLSVLDVPLPNSFDSQGVSHAAQHGPLASSVPPRFGIDSPPSSLPNKALLGNTALRDLHDSAFGDRANLDGVLHGLGSSPPTIEEPLSFTKRTLHSERFSRPKMVSASLGTRPSLFNFNADADTSGSEQSDDDCIGEELLPSSLHELLPQDRLRRISRNGNDDENGQPAFSAAQRRAASNGNTPQDSKVGSMSPHSASPSWYSSIWSSRPVSKPDAEANLPSAFGHVGSPLRPSILRAPSSRTTSHNIEAASYIGSPPRQASMSMLTQELQRSKLADHSKSAQTSLALGTSRTFSSGSAGGRGGLGDRGFSSSSLGRDKIEEEQGLFSMEEEDPEDMSTSAPRSHVVAKNGGRPDKQRNGSQ